MIKTILADDHKVFTDGLEKLLVESKKFRVIGKFHNTHDLLENIYEQSFDLILLDFQMPGLDCEETIQRIRLTKAETKIIVLSMHEENFYSKRVIMAGANSYLTKSLDSTTLIDLILEVVEHGKPHVVTQQAIKLKSILSRQEMTIIKLIADGKTSKDIAEHLNISELTIKVHRRNMLHKMGVNNSSELIKVAISKGIL
jgi:DNA-binding NarL/FixJ family response regulator